MCKIKHCTLLLSTLIALSLQRTSIRKTYRTDYDYNSKTDAFYKLHIERTFQSHASLLCAMEGATLMLPSSKEDLAQAHAMVKKFPDIGNYVWITSDGKSHETAEEQPIIDLERSESQEYEFYSPCDILTRDGEIEITNCYLLHPYICKVDAPDAPYDDQCGVYGNRYFYYSSVGSCYKIPQIVLSWGEAYAECRAEGAHLVILNSEAEHQAVWDLVRAAPQVSGSTSMYYLFAGIRANRPTDGSSSIWRTVFNETLNEAGYDAWSDSEPNSDRDSGFCGTISLTNGKYTDVDCKHFYRFICEKEVHST